MNTNRRNFFKLSAAGAVTALAGTAAAQVKNIRAESGAVQNAKMARLNALPELGATITDFEVRRKRDIPGKRAAFYLDDVIWVFRELAERRPKSVWEHPFLGCLKEAWERYGTKVQLNIFYKDCSFYGLKAAEFTIADMPDIWRDQFQSAKEWLRFSFHSYEEFPDYPWINADYDEVKTMWTMLAKEVERFAGPGMWANAITPHWGPMSKEGCLALKDCGAKVIWVSRGRRWAYDGSSSLLPYGHDTRIKCRRKPETAIYWRPNGGDDISVSACGYNHLLEAEVAKTCGTYNWIHDRATGCNFKAFVYDGLCINLFRKEDIVPKLDSTIARGEPEFYIYGTHEEYFYPHYFNYQPDSREKVLAVAKWMHDHKYEHIFIEDSID